LSFKAIESLNTLRSLHPAIRDNGDLVVRFLPPALEYLRKRSDVQETSKSSKVNVSKESLEPAAVIDYEPEVGARVTAGYQRSGDDHLVRKSELDLTHDGGYARFGQFAIRLFELGGAGFHLRFKRVSLFLNFLSGNTVLDGQPDGRPEEFHHGEDFT